MWGVGTTRTPIMFPIPFTKRFIAIGIHEGLEPTVNIVDSINTNESTKGVLFLDSYIDSNGIRVRWEALGWVN